MGPLEATTGSTIISTDFKYSQKTQITGKINGFGIIIASSGNNRGKKIRFTALGMAFIRCYAGQRRSSYEQACHCTASISLKEDACPLVFCFIY